MNNKRILYGFSLAFVLCAITVLHASDIIKSLSPEEQAEYYKQYAETQQILNAMNPEEQEKFWTKVSGSDIPEQTDRIMSIAIEKTNNEIKKINILLGKKGFNVYVLLGQQEPGREILASDSGSVTLSKGSTEVIKVKDPTVFLQAKAIIENIPKEEFNKYFIQTLRRIPIVKKDYSIYHNFGDWVGARLAPEYYADEWVLEKRSTGRLLWQTDDITVQPGTWQDDLYTLALNTYMKASRNELPRWTWVDTLKSLFGR